MTSPSRRAWRSKRCSLPAFSGGLLIWSDLPRLCGVIPGEKSIDKSDGRTRRGGGKGKASVSLRGGHAGRYTRATLEIPRPVARLEVELQPEAESRCPERGLTDVH